MIAADAGGPYTESTRARVYRGTYDVGASHLLVRWLLRTVGHGIMDRSRASAVPIDRLDRALERQREESLIRRMAETAVQDGSPHTTLEFLALRYSWPEYSETL